MPPVLPQMDRDAVRTGLFADYRSRDYARLDRFAGHGEGEQRAAAETERVRNAAIHAKSLGLIVAAGHGLTYRNVAALAAVPDITEFNIGHNIISRAVFVGLGQAVREMLEAIRNV